MCSVLKSQGVNPTEDKKCINTKTYRFFVNVYWVNEAGYLPTAVNKCIKILT